MSWTRVSGGSSTCVCTGQQCRQCAHLQMESLAVVCEGSCLSGQRAAGAVPAAICTAGGCSGQACLNCTKRADSNSPCWLKQKDDRAISKAPCFGRAACVPSLGPPYLCCRGLHQSSNFLCSILWRALSDGVPMYSQPQESLTKQQTLWIWWLRISCLCSGCL